MRKPRIHHEWLLNTFTKVFLSSLLICLASNTAFSQEQTLNNYSGAWSNNLSWSDGSTPGTTNLNVNVDIYGNIQSYTGLSFNTGDLIVHDTLTIFGNLTLASTADLNIAAGGVLIVRGNYTSGDFTDVTIAAGGYLIVSGSFTMLGANMNGTFDNTNGRVFLLGATTIKTGIPNYADILCTPFGPGCGYGTIAHLEDDPIWSFYNSGGFVVTASGPTSFCAEGSVTLTASNACSGYQWFLNGTAITGATTNSYTANSSGTYTIGFTYGGNLFSIDTTVNEYPIPVPPISGDLNPYSNSTCLYATDEGMTGYNWVVTGGSIIAGQSTNAVQVTWGAAGAGTIRVTYTSHGSCTGTSPIININKVNVPLSCFQYRRQISINNSMVSGGANLIDFPVLIRIQDNTLRHTYHGGHITQYNGYDIMLTSDAPGTTILHHQIDYYNPRTGELFVWVRIPSLSATVPTNVYLFYSNYSITTDHSSTLTWGNDYVNILHMGNNLNDYSQSENNGINNGTDLVTGKIGQGRQFSRTEKDFIQLLNESDFNFHGQTTVSFWMRLDSYPAVGTWMDYIVKGDNVNWRFVGNRTNTNMYYSYGNGGIDNGYQGDLASNNGTVTAGATWYYVVGTFDGTDATNVKRLYINGNLREQTTPGTPLPDDLQSYDVNNEPVLIGINSQADDARAFSGVMDEVRISNSFKSPGWLTTEYRNQNTPGTYLTIGAETQLYSPVAIGGIVDVSPASIYAREFTTADLTGSTGSIQWQSSTNNVNFVDVAGETGTELVTEPLLSTTYFRALVGSGGCTIGSTTDSVVVRPAFFDCIYGHRKKIVITEDKVYGTDDLNNFPVLVRIQDNVDLRHTSSNGFVENINGYDIIFTTGDGTTQLNHQLESYDPASGSLTAWVNLPVLYAEDSTVFFIYYGDPSRTTDPSSNATFSSNYIGVWHMGPSYVDATGHGNNGTNTNTTNLTGASAMINQASGFNGTNAYVTIANESAFDIAPNGKMTISGWIYVNSFTGGVTEQFINKGTNGWYLRENGLSSNDPQFYQTYRGSDYIEAHNNTGLSTGSWHYLVSTFDHASQNVVVYIDGSCANSVKNDPSTSLIHCNNIPVRLGALAGGAPIGFLNGRLDEVRIQNVYRSSDWIRTEYSNQLNPINFIILRDEPECSTDPSPGTAAADYNILCQGQTGQITLFGYTGSIYWQSSPDGNNWSYIRGRSNAVLSVGPLTDTMYYRAAVSSCCQLFSNAVRIDYVNAAPPTLSFVTTDAYCPIAHNGSIDMTINGGIPTYSINWSNGTITEDITNLSAGTYNVTVINGNSCRVRSSSSISSNDIVPPVAVCTANPVIVYLDNFGNGTLTAAAVDGGSYDVCDPSPDLAINLTSFTCTDVGIRTVTLTVTDEHGNFSTCAKNVTIEDDILPAITCPIAVSANASTGNCYLASGSVTLGTPVTGDNCGILSVVNNAPANYPVGTNTVQWTVTDLSGNTAICNQIVTINDIQVPTITCPIAVTVNAAAGLCAIPLGSVSLGIPVTGDNCGIASTVNNAPASLPVGSTTVLWTVTDTHSNTTSCNQIVTVNDNQVPTITCPSTVTINAAAGTCAIASGSVVLGTPTTGDNCGVSGTTNNAPASYPVGNTTVRWTVTDTHSNTASCNQTVTVNDNQVPTITCPATVTVNAAAGACSIGAGSVSLGTPLTADNCGVSGTSNNAPATYPVGNTTVQWTVIDIHSNTASCNQTVTVNDIQVPTITCPIAVTVDAAAGLCSIPLGSVSLGTPATGDNCGLASTINNAPASFTVGSSNVVWTTTDINGNSANCNQTVTVNDNQAPTITCPANVNMNAATGNCSVSAVIVVLGTPLTSDNCGVSGVTNNAPSSDYQVGNNTVTWTVTDVHGNIATCNQTVTIADVDDPVIDCVSDITIGSNAALCSAYVSWTEPTASDGCDASVTIERTDATGITNGGLFPLGITTIGYRALDDFGNIATCSFNVTVTGDSLNPEILGCPSDIGPVSMEPGLGGAHVSWAEPTVSDNCDLSPTLQRLDTTGLISGDLFPSGTTVLSYIATDSEGNTSICSFTITVEEDSEPPVFISCPSDIGPLDIDVTQCGTIVTWVDPVATDNADTNILYERADVTGLNTGDLFPEGLTTIIYLAIDDEGNSDTCSFMVEVHDSIYPAIICKLDTSLCSDGVTPIVNIGQTSYSDNCSAHERLTLSYTISGATNTSGSGDASGTVLSVGISTLSYTVTDISGNTATCSSQIEVLGLPETGATSSDAYTAENDPAHLYIALLCYQVDQDVTFTNTGSSGTSFEWMIDGDPVSGNSNSVVYNHQAQDSGVHVLSTIIIDANSCQSILVDNIFISSPEVDLGADANICNGDQYSFEITGNYDTYYWNGIEGSNSFNTSQGGSVILQVTDTVGCFASDTSLVIIHGLDAPEIQSDTMVCEEFNIEDILDPINTDWQYSSSIVLSGNPDGYIFTIQDPYYCEHTDTIEVMPCEPEDVLDIPNYITPDNADGINDVWEIGNIDKFPDNSIEIYDRAGRLVFKMDHYNNSQETVFRGVDSKDRTLPMDSYFYIIDLKNNHKPIDGNITIIR